jgi:hypothetical protein
MSMLFLRSKRQESSTKDVLFNTDCSFSLLHCRIIYKTAYFIGKKSYSCDGRRIRHGLVYLSEEPHHLNMQSCL